MQPMSVRSLNENADGTHTKNYEQREVYAMRSVMQKIHTPRVAPIFTTNDENALPVGTRSFLEARKWLEDGHKGELAVEA